MAEANKTRLHATIEGRVQGVGFRYFVQERAEVLGLTGWVRNRWNGTVEVVVEGSRENVDKLLTTLQRGPASAYVSEVKAEWQDATGEFYRFSVRSTE